MSSRIERDIDSLWKIFPSISRTFAYTIPKLPRKVALDLAVCYAVCRVIDTIEDTPIKHEERIILSKSFLNVLHTRNIDSSLVMECKQMFNSIPAEMKYKRLLMIIPILNRILKMLPVPIQEIIIKVAKTMAMGFLNKRIQRIHTLSDQNKYCHFAAGIVGYMITEVFQERGYLSGESMKNMMPLAHDFGLALQKVNIIKDVVPDIKEARFYWPKDLLKERNLTYMNLVHPKSREQAQKSIEIVNLLVKDAKPYFENSINYIDKLPHSPEGLRIFCGDNILMAYATLREANSGKVFLNKAKITREEVHNIDLEVTRLVRQRRSLASLAQRISVAPLLS